ncbi:MAG: two-component system sensor histidine kinase NtrB [Phycisphaerae bacterium]
MSDEYPHPNPVDSEQFYQRLFQHAAVAMVAIDSDENIISWNDAARHLLPHTADSMVGKSVLTLVPEERKNLFDRLLKRTLHKGQTSQLELKVPGDNGDNRYLLVVLSPIPTEDGQISGVSAWAIDETQTRKLGERLTQAEKMASLGTLAGGVAHHFNNILGGVATFVDFALTSGDTTSMRRALQMTAEAAARASKITQSLLSFAESEAENAAHGDLADLTEVILTFAHLVEHPLNEHGIQLKLDLNPIPITEVEANRMHQVLGNLLTNAEEAMPDGGTITIGTEQTENEVIVTFADTGGGISQDDLSLVFEPFFTTKGLLSGGDHTNPGLGLSVVHGVILEMGGSIDVQSKPGQGTTFIIKLPKNEAIL